MYGESANDVPAAFARACETTSAFARRSSLARTLRLHAHPRTRRPATRSRHPFDASSADHVERIIRRHGGVVRPVRSSARRTRRRCRRSARAAALRALLQPIGITGAVEALVMMPDDRPHLLQRPQPGAQVASPTIGCSRMTRDSCGSSLPPFRSTRVRHGDLADVVQKAAALERREIRGVESQRPAHARRIRRQPLAVPLRRRVARLDRRAHAEDDRLGRLEIVGVALQPDQRLDAGVELQRIERLAQEIVGSRPRSPSGDRRAPIATVTITTGMKRVDVCSLS